MSAPWENDPVEKITAPWASDPVGESAPEVSAHPTISDLPGNIVPSAVNLAKDIAQPILHPIDTAKGVYKIATDAPTRAAVGQFYKDRYGGLQSLHDTLIKDPVGAVSDIATLLTGGGALAAKLPGLAGKAGMLAARAGSVVDPIANAGRGAVAVGKGAGYLASEGLGKTSFTGSGDAIRTAAESGYKGETSFLDNLRGTVPVTKVLDDLDSGISTIKQKAQASYRKDMANLPDASIDPTPIHDQFAKIMADADSPGTMPLAAKIDDTDLAKIKKVKDVIDDATTETKNQWVPKSGPIGGKWEDVTVPKPVDIFELDALKQKLSGMYPEQGTKTPQVQRVIASINDTIRGEIGKVSPDYLATMEKYSDAQDMLGDIRKSLSATDSVGADTKLMKLRRSLVDSPQGKRASAMVDQIEDASGKPIRAQIAGQAMQNWFPGGGHLAAKLAGLGTAGGGLTAMTAAMGPGALALAPAFSPKAMGYGAYGAGVAARAGVPVFNAVVPSVEAQRGIAQIGRPLDDERIKRAMALANLQP